MLFRAGSAPSALHVVVDGGVTLLEAVAAGGAAAGEGAGGGGAGGETAERACGEAKGEAGLLSCVAPLDLVLGLNHRYTARAARGKACTCLVLGRWGRVRQGVGLRFPNPGRWKNLSGPKGIA